MSTTTMQFGPEWMRTKPQSSSKNQQQAPPPSPPPATSSALPASATASYSALVSPATLAPPGQRDDTHPFRYSKEDMLKIYHESGGKSRLGLEVERWEGVVREVAAEPVSLREMGEAEKRLFAGPLNSELRRRQSSDFLPPLSASALERPMRMNSGGTQSASPRHDRFASLVSRRRDSSESLNFGSGPRKLSLTTQLPPFGSPRDSALSSPRTRIGSGGFDGVLNNDSWLSRRRAAEGVAAKSATGLSREHSGSDDPGPTILEEEETSNSGPKSGPPPAGQSQTSVQHSQSPPAPPEGVQQQQQSVGGAQEADPVVDHVSSRFAPQLSVNANSIQPPELSQINPGPPPGLVDLSTIEWSYLDPQGQIQGPFPASVMQKWHEVGYFSEELLMKRTHLDTDWVSVGELKARCPDNQIFLQIGPFRRSSDFASGPFNNNTFNQPLQPSPIRQLRPSPLDSFMASNSPDAVGSSFGGRFHNASPESMSAFRNGAGNMIPDPVYNSRISGYPAGAEPLTPGRRGIYSEGDALYDGPTHPSYGNVVAPTRRASTMDGYIYGGIDAPSPPWPNNAIPSVYNPNRPVSDRYYEAVGMGNGFGFGNVSDTRQHVYQEPSSAYPLADLQHHLVNEMVPNFTDVQATFQSTQHVSPIEPQSLHSQIPPVGSSALRDEPDRGSRRVNFATRPAFESSAPLSSSWSAPAMATPHVPAVSQQQISPIDTTASVWNSASLSHPADSPVSAWSAGPPATIIEAQSADQSPAIRNLGQPNQSPERQAVESTPAPVVAEEAPEFTKKAIAPPTNEVASPAASSAQALATKARRPAFAQPPPSTPVKKPPPAPAPESPAAAPAQPVKQAWATDDDKPKTPSVALSLREIQEMEEKKAEARKAAEKRERAARALATGPSPPSAIEEIQTNLSWGLPTSQAGARGSAAQKDTSRVAASAVPSPPPPVWTAATGTPVKKKTMKEILEEETRRKKAASKEASATSASAAPKRAYAETTQRTAPLAQNSVWTTVGPNGKMTAPASTRPVSSGASSGPVAVRPNGVSATRPAAVPAVKPAPAPRPEDMMPSTEFLKWLGEALKGLNGSANVEDLITMLLSFQVEDIDASTMELIQDLIYMNSTTMDGRRFATEFVSHRKADLASKSRVPGVSGAKFSIADIVKAQPKSTQPEWGGFKVVNKKRKGGKA